MPVEGRALHVSDTSYTSPFSVISSFEYNTISFVSTRIQISLGATYTELGKQ